MATQETMTLTAQMRENSGKGVARKLRADGLIPGVCYGMGIDNMKLTVDPVDLYKLLTTKRRQNIVFDLSVDGKDTLNHVMVKDYQIDPIRRELLHADFIVVDPAKKVTVTVPVEATGRSRGVREGGRLQMVRPEVSIHVLPTAIPEVIDHDVTNLGLGQAVLASDLQLPEGTEPAYKVDYAVIRIAIPRGLKQAKGEEGEAEAPKAKKK